MFSLGKNLIPFSLDDKTNKRDGRNLMGRVRATDTRPAPATILIQPGRLSLPLSNVLWFHSCRRPGRAADEFKRDVSTHN
jgi:hypothetical protein